jgi:hypothetical protein
MRRPGIQVLRERHHDRWIGTLGRGALSDVSCTMPTEIAAKYVKNIQHSGARQVCRREKLMA